MGPVKTQISLDSIHYSNLILRFPWVLSLYGQCGVQVEYSVEDKFVDLSFF